MNVTSVLQKYHFPEPFIGTIKNSGITHFYPPQEMAIKKGVLKKENILLAVPTASGKTFIAELAMIKSIFQNNGRCLYIAPLKALASEKYAEFKEKYASLGIKIGIATGDFDSPSHFLSRYQILIATAEKVDSLLRSRTKKLVHSLAVVVFDEIHFINDGSRGPTLEILIARIKQLNPNAQILGLSATIRNADELANWLKAKLVFSTWRPVPLKEGVYLNERILFSNDGIREIKEEVVDDLSKVTLDSLRSKGQVLVFVNSRRSAQAASYLLSSITTKILSIDEKKECALIAKELLGPPSEITKVCRKLSEVVLHGAAFHHAGLRPKQRQLIEEYFKRNLIKVICSTPTLAAGVNLPARRTIIRDIKRYEKGLGAAFIPTFEYKQCAGRAGRPKYDEYGESVIMAKTYSESNLLFERYINAQPEPLISKLANESSLRIHVLASIAGGYVHDVNGMFEFMSHTFLYHQKLSGNLIDLISRIFEFLEREEFIEKSGFHYIATPFGQRTSQLYLNPMTAIILREGLRKLQKGKSFSSIGLLHLMVCCPDAERLLNVGKSNFEEIEEFADSYEDEMILSQDDLRELEDFYFFLVTFKTTWMLSRWIDEEKDDIICDRFNVGPGDIHRLIESIQWLLHSANVLADLFGFRKFTFILEELKNRVKYGIKEELLELVRLKGIGRIRARILFNNGYQKLSDLKYVSVDNLARINQIGKSLAKNIFTQLRIPSQRKKSYQ